MILQYISFRFCFIILVLDCFSAKALGNFPFANGIYYGNGKIENKTYLTELKIQPKTQDEIQFSTKYHLSNGEIKNWNFSLKQTLVRNQYQVFFNGLLIGTAECQNEKKYCHYQIPNSKEKLEESFIIQGSVLIRTGSKWIEGKKQNWTEIYTVGSILIRR